MKKWRGTNDTTTNGSINPSHFPEADSAITAAFESWVTFCSGSVSSTLPHKFKPDSNDNTTMRVISRGTPIIPRFVAFEEEKPFLSYRLISNRSIHLC